MLGNMVNDLAEAIRRWTEKKGIVDFAGSDLAKGQLGNGLCKAMDSSIFNRSWSFHPKRLSCLQIVR